MVYARGEGIVLNEPSVIALNSRTGEVLAMGHEAWQMIGRTPSYIVAVRPLRKGAITDFEVTQRMIRLLLQRVGVSRFNRPRVVICVPSAITAVERRAVKEAARRAGAADAQLIEQPMAAAIGAGLPIHEPVGNMVVDIGGGTTETALISLGGIVAIQAVRVGSFDIDAAIQSYVRRVYGIAIGERTAEDIKIVLGSAARTEDEVRAEVRGRELMSGLPKTVVFTPEEIREAIDEVVTSMVDSVLACLAQAPPELAQDLLVEGIQLVGGGGMLRGLGGAHRTRSGRAGASRRHATRMRGARRGPLHRIVRIGAGDVHGRSSSGALANGNKSFAALRTCQSRSCAASSSAATTSGPSNGASASTARRRTVTTSLTATRIAGRPAGSPMAPSAAAAASRTNASGCPDTTSASAATEPAATASPCSPSAHAAASATSGSSSAKAASRETPRSRGGQLAGTPAHSGLGIGERLLQRRPVERAGAGERAERRDPHHRVGIGPRRQGRSGVAAVGRDRDRSYAIGGGLSGHVGPPARISTARRAPSASIEAGRGSLLSTPAARCRFSMQLIVGPKKEPAVSYMVLYTGLDSSAAFERCEELAEAVAEVERLRNEQSIDGAQIYRLEEVKFEIKPYFRVELPERPPSRPASPRSRPPRLRRSRCLRPTKALRGQRASPAVDVHRPAATAAARSRRADGV